MDGTPETRSAQNRELSIADQVVGDDPIDLVFAPGCRLWPAPERSWF